MAKVVSSGFDELAAMFGELADHSGDVAAAAVYAGAGLMADKLRSSLDNLQVEDSREHKTKSVLPYEKVALQNGMVITKFIRDKGRGFTQTSITFKGRSDHRTESFPDGVPTILLARAITKGTTFRIANRFIPNTANRNRKAVEQLMAETTEREFMKHIK